MKPLLPSHLFVKPSVIHGYGVFAAKAFMENEMIEECYSILSTSKDVSLNNYYFVAGKKAAIPTGFGLIYNHSNQPNATYFFDEARNLTIYKALRPIQPGEEIVISYGKNWFSDRAMPIKSISWPRWLLRFSAGAPLRTSIVISSLLLLNQLLHVLVVR
jgi:SET domain-containing protein